MFTLWVIVSLQQVFGPFDSEEAAITYAKKYTQGVTYIVRPILPIT